MSLYRNLARSLNNQLHQQAVRKNLVPWYQQKEQLTAVESWWKENGYPIWFKFVKGPYERFNYEREVSGLRGYGLMYDDTLMDKEPVIERALELLPPDLAIARYRRMMRAADLSLKKAHLPVEDQNYDPMIPYLAPFVEEAKFQMQEEQELLQYHPWDRRLYSGGLTGLGETTQFSTFSSW
jgi:ubiquinol-cytochrome c reductase subunit 7